MRCFAYCVFETCSFHARKIRMYAALTHHKHMNQCNSKPDPLYYLEFHSHNQIRMNSFLCLRSSYFYMEEWVQVSSYRWAWRAAICSFCMNLRLVLKVFSSLTNCCHLTQKCRRVCRQFLSSPIWSRNFRCLRTYNTRIMAKRFMP